MRKIISYGLDETGRHEWVVWEDIGIEYRLPVRRYTWTYGAWDVMEQVREQNSWTYSRAASVGAQHSVKDYLRKYGFLYGSRLATVERFIQELEADR